MNNKKFLYSGQALLIVLLSMAVVLVVVLSILARSITDVSISSQDESSLRAFSAAEAGVERALIIGSDIGLTELGGASYSVNVTAFAQGESKFIYPTSLFSGESATVWFISHDENGNYICTPENPCFTGNRFQICWGKEGVDPAIEVSIFYTSTPGDYSTTKVARMAVDPSTARRLNNNFIVNGEGSCTVEGITYPYFKNINFGVLGIPNSNIENVLQFASIRLLYNNDVPSPLAIVGLDGSVFPSQGLKIESSGLSGDANRKIGVYKFFSESAEVFQFGVFSFGSIVK